MEKEKTQEEHILRLGSHEVLFDYGIVRFQGNETSLTAKELALLLKLHENRGRIVTFDALCNAAWGDGYYGYENTLMVHIRHLREKLRRIPLIRSGFLLYGDWATGWQKEREKSHEEPV